MFTHRSSRNRTQTNFSNVLKPLTHNTVAISSLCFTLLSVLILFSACGTPTIQKPEIPPAQPDQPGSEQDEQISQTGTQGEYQYPDFYKGIYLNYTSGMNRSILNSFVEKSKRSGINTFVIDVQPAPSQICPIPESHVKLLLDNGIHPIARIVCFDQGLRRLPVPEGKIEQIYKIAESAAQKGFKEIQFDYIRFADQSNTTVHGVTKKLSPEEKYEFVEGLLGGARERLRPYNVRTAADIFGRIPWLASSGHDVIGQKVENLDKVVDVICPMAYPSHYWHDKESGINWINTPYETVHKTAKMAKEKADNAIIVTYIQAFEIKVQQTGLSYAEYIKKQIEAVHDTDTGGYIMWNARQVYTVPFEVTKAYYRDNPAR